MFLKRRLIFDGPCEHLWKSNQKNIFILLIFLLKSTPCWLTSAKLHHWGHTNTYMQCYYIILSILMQKYGKRFTSQEKNRGFQFLGDFDCKSDLILLMTQISFIGIWRWKPRRFLAPSSVRSCSYTQWNSSSHGAQSRWRSISKCHSGKNILRIFLCIYIIIFNPVRPDIKS